MLSRLITNKCETSNDEIVGSPWISLSLNDIFTYVHTYNDYHSSDCKFKSKTFDLTPLNYFLWGYIKLKAYANQPAMLKQLEDSAL